MFRTEYNAVHFSRTLVHITLKEFIIHNAAFEHPYSAIVMSTDLLQLAIFLFNELLLCLFLGESIYFQKYCTLFMINRFAKETSNHHGHKPNCLLLFLSINIQLHFKLLWTHSTIKYFPGLSAFPFDIKQQYMYIIYCWVICFWVALETSCMHVTTFLGNPKKGPYT